MRGHYGGVDDPPEGWLPPEPPTVFRAPSVPDREVERFALDADVTVYWPWVRPCWEESVVR